ncbi:cytidylyltransferase domain-containing protein [Ectobacillus sp. sgz5001026]|uniref:acylneuraminate cytidylyltransferase family protein n=1 Tax=Ectobacillus sp. sgz5001026 TaxID=3242473 RepID=UPI0036D39979
MKNIAIIPARSGSKGLKDKNIKLLNGKPLIAYTIEAAKESKLFDEIFVSTDSENYAEIAREYGASVPFLRSKDLSSDTASSWDVVTEVLNIYEEKGKQFDSFALLQPTSPRRKAENIIKAYELLQVKRANAIVGVTEAEHSPLWCGILPEDQTLVGFFKNEKANQQRQKLEPYYRINGAIYVVKTDYFQSTKDIYECECYAYVMSRETSIDIDNALDFALASIMDKIVEGEY